MNKNTIVIIIFGIFIISMIALYYSNTNNISYDDKNLLESIIFSIFIAALIATFYIYNNKEDKQKKQ